MAGTASLVIKRWGRAHYKWPGIPALSKDGLRIFIGLKPSAVAKKAKAKKRRRKAREKKKKQALAGKRAVQVHPGPVVRPQDRLVDDSSSSSGGGDRPSDNNNDDVNPLDGNAVAPLRSAGGDPPSIMEPEDTLMSFHHGRGKVVLPPMEESSRRLEQMQ